MPVPNTSDVPVPQESTTETAVPDAVSIDEQTLTNKDRLLEFRQLDARSIDLVRFVHAVLFSVIIVAALIVGSVLMWFIPFPLALVIPLIWIGLLGLGALNVVWWPRWDHNCWSYRVGDKLVELRYGVLWKVSVVIPLSRLQHADLHRGPFERRWGLASLEIHTAGTRDASHRIPGLDVAIATELRDELIAAANRGAHAPAKD